MNTPALLLGTTLMFWGMQTGLLWAGIPAALLLEGSRLTLRRRLFSHPEFRRIVFLCDLLLLTVCLRCLAISMSGDYTRAGFHLIQLLPLALLPLMIVQAYGMDEKIDIRKLSLYVSRKKASVDRPPLLLNITWLYWGICLLAAGMSSAGDSRFYPCFCFLIFWGLWSRRPAYARKIIWLPLVFIVTTVGYAGYLQLHALQGKVEEQAIRLLSGANDIRNSDPSRSTTALGRIGSLKLSGRIMLRVKPVSGITVPLLLREASYNAYRDATWFAGRSDFRRIFPEQGGENWPLAASPSAKKQLQIVASLEQGKGLLPLPSGTERITGLPAGMLKQSRLGAVLVADGPRRINYGVDYEPGRSYLQPPGELDLQVPASLVPLLAPLAARLEVARKSPEEIITTVVEYFQNNFRYATVQKELKAGQTALENFLLVSHAGHCEFFATATVLLLRTAGIPARYVTGYSVQEYSPWEKVYLVRSRHAHAWVETYLDGAWRTLDTTPQSWASREEPGGVSLEPVSDLWSWFTCQLSRLPLAEIGKLPGSSLIWLLLPLILYYSYRLLRSPWQLRRQTGAKQNRTPSSPGADSEWYLLEQHLIRMGLARQPLEKSGDWLQRITPHLPLSSTILPLQEIFALHCRYRFDPRGITAAERTELKNSLDELLRATEKHQQLPPAAKGAL